MFGTVDWNYSAGPPIRKGKSMEELGDAGWARERERAAHLQQLQHLQQVQLQQQQVGYHGYAVVPPGQPQGPVMLARPGDPAPLAAHGGMMVPGGLMPPQVHLPPQWPVQWADHLGWDYSDGQKAAFIEKSHPRQDVYFHPGSEDGHLDVRISEWKGTHCFYQGPGESRNVAHDNDDNEFRTDEDLEDSRREDNRVRENYHYSECYERSHRRAEEFDSKERYRYREHYDGQHDDYDDNRENPHYSSRKQHKSDRRQQESYNSEYEDYYERKNSHANRDSYKDSGHYSDRDYYDSRESRRYREDEHYRRRKDNSHYDDYEEQRYYSDHYAEDRYGSRENDCKDRGVYNKYSEGTYTSRRRRQYDSEPETHCGYKKKERSNRYKDTCDNRRDGDYDHKRREHYKAEHYERWPVDYHDYDTQDSRKGEPSHSRERYRDLRSLSVDSSYEEYPKNHSKTHCEEWVEQQNKKLALGEMRSFEDPIVYHHSDEQEKGYESSTGTTRSKRGVKPVYVGSLDRNSFYRKTAPSSVRKSQFATTMRKNKGKHTRDGMYFGTYKVPSCTTC